MSANNKLVSCNIVRSAGVAISGLCGMTSGSALTVTVFCLFSGKASRSSSEIRCLRSGDPDRRTGDAKLDCADKFCLVFSSLSVNVGAGWSFSTVPRVLRGLRRPATGDNSLVVWLSEDEVLDALLKSNFDGDVISR